MDEPPPDWPATRWNLTAPESYVLNSVGDGSGVEAFKLAVKELVARGALRIEPVETRGRLGARKRQSALTQGPQFGRGAGRSLAPVLEVFANAEKRTLQSTEASRGGARPVEGVLVEALAKAARKQLGGFDRYRDECVVRGLEERGLMTVSTRRVLGVFASSRKGWTESGRQAVDELEEWMRVGRERVRRWALDDPAKALAYASGAGAAVLLMGDLYPDFEPLEQRLAERGGGRAGGGEGGASGHEGEPADAEPSAADSGELELGGLELDFGGLGSSFDSIDAGIDAGAGGDGGFGGGDGGGGGGDGGGGGGSS